MSILYNELGQRTLECSACHQFLPERKFMRAKGRRYKARGYRKFWCRKCIVEKPGSRLLTKFQQGILKEGSRRCNRAQRVLKRQASKKATIRAFGAERRALEHSAMPQWADRKAIRAIYRRCLEMTTATGIPHHVDHIIPLKHPKVCGLHVPENLQILTAEDNLRKSNKWRP